MRRGHRFTVAEVTLTAVCAFLLPVATGDTPDPIEIDKVERENVRLLLVDAIVLDGKGRTVGDLTLEDFQVSYDGDLRRPADTLDVHCAEDSQDDPLGGNPRKRSAAAALEDGRRIVIALDYLHLPRYARYDVIDQALAMVRHGAAPGDEFMLVALNGGLRIEQAFTSDHQRVTETLQRMQYDITLWQPAFAHRSEAMFIEPMTALLEVLAAFEGTKAIVLYSSMADVPLDSQFADLAAVAAASRSTIYPVDCRGLVPPRPKNGAASHSVSDIEFAPG